MDRTRPAVLLTLVSLLVSAPVWSPARSDEVELADGRVLQGRFVLLPGVAIAPEGEEVLDPCVPISLGDADELGDAEALGDASTSSGPRTQRRYPSSTPFREAR